MIYLYNCFVSLFHILEDEKRKKSKYINKNLVTNTKKIVVPQQTIKTFIIKITIC